MHLICTAHFHPPQVVYIDRPIHQEGASDKKTVRSVFIIDPNKYIQLHLTYPMSIGRNFDEILRAIDALQMHDDHQVLTPANWKPTDDIIVDPNMPLNEVQARFPDREVKGVPYLQFSSDPSKKE